MARARRYWLAKSEPEVYSISDLERDGSTSWEGVRNHQAKNFMRDEMKKGDLVLFYHSNADPAGVAGVAEVSREAYPDDTAWDPKSPYHDTRSSRTDPVWFMVDVAFVQRFPEVVTLAAIKADRRLSGVLVAQRGQRLSVQPVSPEHFHLIVSLGQAGVGSRPKSRKPTGGRAARGRTD